ncbi:hypothetical protein AB0I30_00290 [Nocardia tengchongensis]|uniref:hypothetical protein n=1 Tax=Nocardia tengchongensis TaxID=2055889 RepID=UPI0033F3A2B5
MTMFEIPIALGYLRSDVSGVRQPWDEERNRSLAARLGYQLAKTVAFSGHTDYPVQRLILVVRTTGAEAVFVPNLTHLGGSVPEELLQVADVITIEPEATYARWAIPPYANPEMRTR